MTMTDFREILSQVTRWIEGLPLNSALEAQLNREFPVTGKVAQKIIDACRDAIARGWMCNREAGGTVRVLYLLPQGAIEFSKN